MGALARRIIAARWQCTLCRKGLADTTPRCPYCSDGGR